MAREHQDYVKGVFTTPFGPMEYALTSGTHVSITAGGSYDKKAPQGIVVNGVPYRTHVHLHLQPSGVWHANPGDRSAIYMSRTDTGKDATFAALKKGLAGVTEAWGSYAETEPQLFGEAEWRHISNKIMDVEEKAEEARKVYEALANEHSELLAREKEFLP